MTPTNYHLFDFMDFSPSLRGGERLWKACAPTRVVERDGDILIYLPYQRQLRQPDMAPDVQCPPLEHVLTVRAYSPGIVRLFTSMVGDRMAEASDMLVMAPEVRRMALSLRVRPQPAPAGGAEDHGGQPAACVYEMMAGDSCVGVVDLTPPLLDHWSDLLPPPQSAPAITFFPDGDRSKPIALSDDHFSPPRYDALPLGFVCSSPTPSPSPEGRGATAKETATTDSEAATLKASPSGGGLVGAVGGMVRSATISFRCAADECFAGTGERFRKMDLSGSSFFLKNQDGQGVNNSRCYKNIPFYLSSRGYGAFFHTSDYCKLDLACHSTRSVQFLCHRATIDVFLIGGATPADVLLGYRRLTGFPQMPPLWSFGVWMSRMTYFSAQEVEDVCQRLRREHYPCDVIHLDTGWFRTDWLCEWRFNRERFPDPEAFIRRLASQGFKVSLWQLPYISEEAEQYEEAKEKGYMSRPDRTQQKTRQTHPEDGEATSNFSSLDYAGTIDFTYPAAVRWYQQELLGPLLRMGVKCIKTDFGENIHTDHLYHAMTAERLNNLYALLYQRAAWEASHVPSPSPDEKGAAMEASPSGGGLVGASLLWSRAAWAGCQRYPVHWGGDSESSWDGMAGSLKGGLHLGLSGFAFWSHDVPGFHSTPDFMNSPVDPTVYVRWTQFGVFTSHIRYHGTSKREPWHYPSVAPIVKRWWRLRYRLMPYIVEQSERCCRSGMPMLRALLLHHPGDRQVWHIDDEYYFGDEFLVCPVMNSEGRRDIYLPTGKWVHFFTGERFEGGRWHYGVETPLELMPVFVRECARIPLYPYDVDSTDDMDLTKATVLEITEEFQGLTLF